MDLNKEVQVVEVIVSKQLLRGNGKESPYRRVTQVFSKDGLLIAESDPCIDCSEDNIKNLESSIKTLRSENLELNNRLKVAINSTWTENEDQP